MRGTPFWDAHWDALFATIGAMSALLLLSRVHDKARRKHGHLHHFLKRFSSLSRVHDKALRKQLHP